MAFHEFPLPAASGAQASPMRLLLVAAVLFLFYQLPEGIGMYELRLLFPLAAWWASRSLGFSGMRAWYLDARPGWWRLLGTGLVLAIAAKFTTVAIGARTGVYTLAWADAAPGMALAGSLAFLAFSSFIASLAEDILTRGLVMRAFPQLAGRWTFILVSAALFVLNHIYRLHKGPVEWLTIFCFGLAYAAALYRTGTLWAAVGLHWGWNLANGLLDTFARSDVVQPAVAPFYSGAAHLVLLACVLILMRPARPVS
ncbi:CPBP family intramembrane glutamic endopeptidase [Massilia aerilata]|uniref:CPBP family intramembrane glutamic endopeptidase n=1 Tax=Massilia aerilata TaxID=453817 RepID=A0ABW0S3R1_9BURK